MKISNLKEIKIDFYPDNLELLSRLLKTTTLRTDAQAKKIGLNQIGEQALFKFTLPQGLENIFIVTYLGKKTVDEFGGKDKVYKTEGFEHTYSGKPKFSSTIEFLEGKRALHLYSFEAIDQTEIIF